MAACVGTSKCGLQKSVHALCSYSDTFKWPEFVTLIIDVLFTVLIDIYRQSMHYTSTCRWAACTDITNRHHLIR